MARKTIALQKRQKKKMKINSSTSLTASKVESKEKVKDDNINQEMDVTVTEGQHITTHQNGEECDCFLRRANMFLPANLLPENSSSISNSNKR